MSTVRGTTPVYTFHIEGIDISGNSVFLTIQQDDFRKTWCNKTDKEVFRVTNENGNTALTLYLSQSDTLAFRPGVAEVEVKWLSADGIVSATNIASVNFTRTLLEEVISDETDTV